MDEAMRDMAGKPLSLRGWHAVTHQRLEQSGDGPLLTPDCSFEAIYQNTEQHPNSTLSYPASEVVYSRSD